MNPNDKPAANFVPNRGSEEAIDSLASVVDNLKGEIKGLKEIIKNYSTSSDKHANAMKWLTAGLFAVAILQVVAALILKN